MSFNFNGLEHNDIYIWIWIDVVSNKKMLFWKYTAFERCHFKKKEYAIEKQKKNQSKIMYINRCHLKFP